MRLSGGCLARPAVAARMALPVAVAAALTIGAVPALLRRTRREDARKLGAPGIAGAVERGGNAGWGPAAPALSGASAAQPVNAPAPITSEAPSGAPEAAAEPLPPRNSSPPRVGRRSPRRAERRNASGRSPQSEHEIALLASDADASRRSLAESRAEQARLLGTILHRVRSQARDTERCRCTTGRAAARRGADAGRRPGAARPAARPDRRDRAARCASEADRRQEGEEAAARQALATARERLAAAVARRSALLREMLPPQSIDAALRIADTEREAKGIGDLIKRAEAAEERGGKPREPKRAGRSRSKPAPPSQASDPTRPSELRSLSQEAGSTRLTGPPSGRPQDGGRTGRRAAAPAARPAGGRDDRRPRRRARQRRSPNEGLSLDAVPGATVVAPFDGRILYAGPFRDLGRVLIIRHDRRYYSVLAGLGRVDAKLGDWVLAGEPVGAMPDIPSPRSGAEAREAQEAILAGCCITSCAATAARSIPNRGWRVSRIGHDERNGEQKVSQ